MNDRTLFFTFWMPLCAATALLVGCAPAPRIVHLEPEQPAARGKTYDFAQTVKKVEPDGPGESVPARLAKKRIAVASFLAVGRKAKRDAGANVVVNVGAGAGDPGAQMAVDQAFTDMFVGALIGTENFLVVERPELDKVILEQLLGLSPLGKKSTAPKLAELVGAQLIAVGTVDAAQGQDVTVTYRVLDTTTGNVVTAGSTSGKTRAAASKKAAEAIDASTGKPVWTARVAAIETDAVWISAGKRDGVTKFDRFHVETVVSDVRDPETGEPLAASKRKAAILIADEVEEAATKCKIRFRYRAFRVGDPVRADHGTLDVEYGGE